MLDVHPPHNPVHGWRDFLLHLVTITIGLLIALSLEGCVEWQHRRHLVHEAEGSLHDEIKANAASLHATIEDIGKQQANLRNDVDVLRGVLKTGKLPEGGHLEIGFNIRDFRELSWKTAQSTGALSYMPYATAQEYSGIYTLQEEFEVAERQAARDAILSLAPFMNSKDKDPDPTPAEAAAIIEKIQILEGQLFLVNSLVTGLDGGYKNFLASHP